MPDPPGPETFDTGVAGASASRQYERRVVARELRVKDRFGRRVGGVLLAVTDEPQSTRAWRRGAQGEQELAKALSGIDGLRLLHDRRVPGTRGNIDHLAIAPAGVFVIDAKLYAGRIEIRDVGGLFKRDERLFVGGRDRSKLSEGMARQVAAVRTALAEADTDEPVTPVLCFIRGDWPLLRPPTSYRGVRLEGTHSIRKLLTAKRDLDDSEIDRLARILSTALPPTSS